MVRPPYPEQPRPPEPQPQTQTILQPPSQPNTTTPQPTSLLHRGWVGFRRFPLWVYLIVGLFLCSGISWIVLQYQGEILPETFPPTSDQATKIALTREAIARNLTSSQATNTVTMAHPSTTVTTTRLSPPTPHPYPTFHSVDDGWTELGELADIQRSNPPPFPSTVFTWENTWHRIHLFKGYHTDVYAGGESPDLPRGDPQQGLLVLINQTSISNSLYVIEGPEIYRTPLKVGPVQIVWADKNQLFLVAADDTSFLFDVASRQWLWPPLSKPLDQKAEQVYQTRIKPMFTTYVTPAPAGYGWPTPDPTESPEVPATLSPKEAYAAGAGIIFEDYGEAAGDPIIGRNTWEEQLVDKRIIVVAGNERRLYNGDPQQGLLLVDGCPGGATGEYADMRRGGASFYETPRKAGSVRVIGAVGEKLRLRSQDGTIFVFDVAACRWLVPPIPTPTASTPTFTPTFAATPWYDDIWPTEERAYVARMENMASKVLTTVALTPRPTTPVPATPTVTPIPAGVGAIVQMPLAPYGVSTEKFRPRNYWFEVQAKRRITVYAGVEGTKGNRVQGMIVVETNSPGGQHRIRSLEYYRTPSESGYVEVMGADGEGLHLKTPNGTEFTFNLTRRQWATP